MTTPPLVPPFGGQPPHPPQQQQQQAQAARDVNTSSLCRYGEETVQDIVLRTMEIFQLLRNMQLPNGVTYHPNTHQDRLGKLQEHLRMLSVLFRKLRLVYDKCSENCAGLDPIPPEQLIPFVEEDGSKHEDCSAGQSQLSSEERREILEVNKRLKELSQIQTLLHILSASMEIHRSLISCKQQTSYQNKLKSSNSPASFDSPIGSMG
uniref:Mediator of RNA polymerase II transcription subunit 30 n=1 Tax=Nothobranchius furzeri TaxID=105023 RepID=A0A8C6LSE3_NOTFU